MIIFIKDSKDYPLKFDRIHELVHHYRQQDTVYVTRPTMPDLQKYTRYLERIWETQWLTNDGEFHEQFEERLRLYLGVEHLNLLVNGTIALLVALQALRINGGEVITTPFTFPATPHVLYWNNIRPVFCDIEKDTMTIDPVQIEKHITPDTKAILAVHVYGNPCDVEAIDSIAQKHGLYVIYDAAHAFGVKVHGRSLLEYGDISALSFHATKLFSSIEGGALVSHSHKQKERIRFLRNFGIANEEHVIGPGINGKMNEFQACFGLLHLDVVNQEIEKRRQLTDLYRKKLANLDGIRCLKDILHVKHNYAYLPILIDQDAYGIGRDRVYAILKECNIMTRKYFHPLCSNYPCYAALPSSIHSNLPVAHRISNEVLCLPLYGELAPSTVEDVCKIIQEIPNTL